MQPRKQLVEESGDGLIPLSERQEMRSPAVTLLSNGSYSVMITNAGSGYSTWGDLDNPLARRRDARGLLGQFYYVRDH